MRSSCSIFSQILKLFPRTDFEKLVRKIGSDYRSKGLSSWDQFVAMLFCQLGRAHSLREIEGGLKSCEGKLNHLGINAPVRSTLSYANAKRPWELYEQVFFGLYQNISGQLALRKKKFKFKNKLVSLDSTIIDLSLSMYDWAKFRRTKGAVKLHMVLDHDGYLPCFGIVTDGKVHDVNAARMMEFSPGTIVVDDRGYNDYRLFSSWTKHGVFFVTRMKDNAQYEVIRENSVSSSSNIISDQIIQLTGIGAQEKCPHRLRRVIAVREDAGEYLVFLTNHFGLASTTIAAIYKDRWQIELFFKALKQNLKIKTFIGTSANAVKIQIWTALIAMLLLRFMQLKSGYDWSLSNLVALLRMNLFTHRDLWAWLNKPFDTPPIENLQQQMTFWF
jgi:hypothetical protein